MPLNTDLHRNSVLYGRLISTEFFVFATNSCTFTVAVAAAATIVQRAARTTSNWAKLIRKIISDTSGTWLKQ